MNRTMLATYNMLRFAEDLFTDGPFEDAEGFPEELMHNAVQKVLNPLDENLSPKVQELLKTVLKYLEEGDYDQATEHVCQAVETFQEETKIGTPEYYAQAA